MQNLISQLARSKGGGFKVPSYKLAEILDIVPPPQKDPLAALRQSFHNFKGLPQIQAPATLQASLRPYQLIGLQWMAFLKF